MQTQRNYISLYAQVIAQVLGKQLNSREVLGLGVSVESECPLPIGALDFLVRIQMRRAL